MKRTKNMPKFHLITEKHGKNIRLKILSKKILQLFLPAYPKVQEKKTWDDLKVDFSRFLLMGQYFSIKLLCFYLLQLHQIKAQQFYTDLDPYQKCWVLQKTIEFKDFSRLLSDYPVLFKTFQDQFQGIFKKAL